MNKYYITSIMLLLSLIVILLFIPSSKDNDSIVYVEALSTKPYTDKTVLTKNNTFSKISFSTEDDSFNSFTTSNSDSVCIKYMSDIDENIASLEDTQAWLLISDGLIDSYPTCSFREIKDIVSDIKQSKTEEIKVKCWYWEDPSDEFNFNKVPVEYTMVVNRALANVFKHIFDDIFSDPSMPIINIEDKGMGTWVLRGKNHSDKNTLSAHSLGTAIDINPSTGSLQIDSKTYGNAYGNAVLDYEKWVTLPESHTKYHMLYKDSPIVQIFKAYGFIWGGDWKTTKDPMHFSYLGDGTGAREKGISNYMAYKGGQ